MVGAIGTQGDFDLFRFSTTPGSAYSVTLETADSSLEGHLTVFDDGRNDDRFGEDYVKIVRSSGSTATIDVLAMGQGGYFVAVRDARNVDGAKDGGDGFGYQLIAQEVDASTLVVEDLEFPSTTTSKLPHAGAIHLYPFVGSEGADVRISMTGSGDTNGRLFIYSSATQDWIARNDDSHGSFDPLIDGPLTASGAMLLVVENIAEQGSTFGYSLTASRP